MILTEYLFLTHLSKRVIKQYLDLIPDDELNTITKDKMAPEFQKPEEMTLESQKSFLP